MPETMTDPVLAERLRLALAGSEQYRHDEVWEGELVVPPQANNEHQRLVSRLTSAFSVVIDWDAGDQAVPGCNVSDRDAGWTFNYRDPDVAVYLATNPAKDSGTHWVGGPDLAVEIVSPGEDPRLKLDFYAAVNTRELLVVERDPWAVEQYQLQGGKLVLVATADATNGVVLTSAALPLTVELRAGAARPAIHLAHTGTQQTWTA